MKASILDLRYRMTDVLRAIDRGETVTVLHRGKVKARLVPLNEPAGGEVPKAADLPFCGMWKDRKDMADPTAYIRKLRQPRYANLFQNDLQPTPSRKKKRAPSGKR